MEDEYYYEKYIQYYHSTNIDEIGEITKDIDNSMYEDSNKVYNGYPNYNEEDFIYELSNKLEFSHLKSLLNISELDKRCEESGSQFELSNNQQFLRNFINKKTPYRGLVIFHGVGVGKTCSAINISRSFRDIYMSEKEKIICLVPKNIRGGWEKTIFDKKKGTEQCSGNSFEDIINNTGRITDKKVKSMIKEYYEFYGYLKFANYVKKLLKTGIGNLELSTSEREEKEKEIIRNHFSHRILIIDEIHNLREENDDNTKGDAKIKIKKGSRVRWEDKRGIFQYGEVLSSEGKDIQKIYQVRREDTDTIEKISSELIKGTNTEEKKAREVIEKVINYSEGLRLIMLSATPIFNKSKEIIWLLNLLLKNDNRPTLKYDEIFKKSGRKGGDDILRSKGIDIIRNKSKGYFSYLRGENPITFPIRFYPDINNDKLCMGGDYNKKINYIDYPTLSLFKNKEKEHIPLDKKYQFQFLKMYNTLMLDKQRSLYESFVDYVQTKKQIQKLGLSDRNIGIQISNIVYSDGDTDGTPLTKYGRKGYNQIFSEKTERKRKVCSYLNKDNPILDIENLQNISCKIHTIITNLLKNKTEGIIFIYSDFIYSGILPLAIALEHIGFEKYNGNNILNYPEWKEGTKDNSTKREPIDYKMNPVNQSGDKRAKYIILTGDKSLSPDNESERLASLHENNIYGENIKVILGNTVTSEGMDFRNIREVHVLDPWYHLYKIEQIIGRGIRYCSHSLQPKMKQNVTVYLHTSSIDHPIESIDTNTYRLAEEKASQIGKIEKILKENAIDCFLNKQINHISHLNKISMKTSWNKNVVVDINDKDFTKICSFSGEDITNKSKQKVRNNGCIIHCNIRKEKLDQLLLSIRDNSNIDEDTFTIENISESIQTIYKIIKELYEEYNCYTIDELTSRIMMTMDTNKKIIYHSLEEMIDNKWVVWNNGCNGYIIRSNIYYLFQPFHNNDIYLPYIYRSTTTKVSQQQESKGRLKLDYNIKIKNDFNCDLSYDEVYEKIKLSVDTLKDEMDYYRPFLSNIKQDIFIDHSIDKLTFSEKKIILETILCDYIQGNYSQLTDPIDKIILQFFENNLIRMNKNDEYNILDKGNGKVVGFFLFNTNEYYLDTRKEVLNDYSYFIYENEQWKTLDNVGIQTIQTNFAKNKIIRRLFKTSQVWGYSFKDDANNHTFKIIDNTTYDNKVPGKIIGNKGVKPFTLLKDFSKTFKVDFKLYIKHIISLLEDKMKKKEIDSFRERLRNISIDEIIKIILEEVKNRKIKGDKKIISKEFIALLFEFSLRSTYTFLNYDLFLLKFIS